VAASVKRSKTEGSVDNGEDLRKLSMVRLQAFCAEYGMVKSGKKDDLVKRLCGPRPPGVCCRRKKMGLYVPQNVDSGPTALLVALQILQDSVPEGQDYAGTEKDAVYVLAENLGITKNPFSGGTTQTGSYRTFRSRR
jgi:hypothetical protein